MGVGAEVSEKSMNPNLKFFFLVGGGGRGLRGARV